MARYVALTLSLALVVTVFGQDQGRRPEIEDSLQNRYRLTKVGPSALGMRGNENSIRHAGGVVLLKKNGLWGSYKRNRLVSNAIYGERVELLSGNQQDAVPITAGERFYVIAVAVSSDAITVGLLSVANIANGNQNGQIWASLNFFFDKTVLDQGDGNKIFPELDQWLVPEGMQTASAAPAAAPPAARIASAGPATSSASSAPASAAIANPSIIKLQPGMSREEVVSALGAPQREVVFGGNTFLEYQSMTAVLQQGKLTALNPSALASGVKISSEPTHADVVVGGDFVGSTPLSLRLQPGTYKITVKLAGYKDWQRDLKVLSGGDVNLDATLGK